MSLVDFDVLIDSWVILRRFVNWIRLRLNY